MKHLDLIRTLLAVIITAAMVAAAELTGEKEIVFPEIMALATGALVAPKRPWQVSPSKMIALIAPAPLRASSSPATFPAPPGPRH